jgi:hypothetical protein
MADTTTEKTDFKIEKLQGSENFDTWGLNLISVLISKDVEAALDYAPHATLTAEEQKKAKLAWSIIIQSLSSKVQASLSPKSRDWQHPNASHLYTELKETYSATSGARLASLLSEMFKTTISEEEEPQVALGKIRLAHTQLNSNQVALSEMVLAHAMLMALPESYNAMRQTLLVQKSLDSETVMSSVQNEWQSRKNRPDATSTALVSTQHKRNFQKRDPNMWCSFHNSRTHWTRDCRSPHDNKGSVGSQNDQRTEQGNYKANTTETTTANAFTTITKIIQTQDDKELHSTFQNYKTSYLNIAYSDTPTDLSVDDGILDAHDDKFMDGSLQNSQSYSVFGADNKSLNHIKSTNTKFLIDSGADQHMVNDISLLLSPQPCFPRSITVGNGDVLPCNIQGQLKFGPVTLTGVLFVPGLKHNLISVSQSPGEWRFFKTSAALFQDGKSILQVDQIHGLYSHCLISQVGDDLAAWHNKLGHLNVKDIAKLASLGKLGDFKPSTSEIQAFQCDYCVMGKGTRLPAPPVIFKAPRTLALIHIDLWGPSPVVSLGGSRFFLTCVDDYSRKINLTFLKTKSQAFKALCDYISKAERQLNLEVLKIRSDNGGEFISNQMASWLQQQGIEHVRTPPAAHSQQGRVERAHLTILNGVRTLLIQTMLPKTLWAEAASYIAYTRNLSPSSPLNKIPEEFWRPLTLDFQRLQPFGRPCFYRNHKPANKLDTRYLKGLFVGYTPGSTSYRIYSEQTGQIYTSRDVIWAKVSPTQPAEITEDSFEASFDVSQSPEPPQELGEFIPPPPIRRSNRNEGRRLNYKEPSLRSSLSPQVEFLANQDTHDSTNLSAPAPNMHTPDYNSSEVDAQRNESYEDSTNDNFESAQLQLDNINFSDTLDFNNINSPDPLDVISDSEGPGTFHHLPHSTKSLKNFGGLLHSIFNVFSRLGDPAFIATTSQPTNLTQGTSKVYLLVTHLALHPIAFTVSKLVKSTRLGTLFGPKSLQPSLQKLLRTVLRHLSMFLSLLSHHKSSENLSHPHPSAGATGTKVDVSITKNHHFALLCRLKSNFSPTRTRTTLRIYRHLRPICIHRTTIPQRWMLSGTKVMKIQQTTISNQLNCNLTTLIFQTPWISTISILRTPWMLSATLKATRQPALLSMQPQTPKSMLHLKLTPRPSIQASGSIGRLQSRRN